MTQRQTQPEVRQELWTSWAEDLALILWSYVQKSQRRSWKREVAVEWQQRTPTVAQKLSGQAEDSPVSYSESLL